MPIDWNLLASLEGIRLSVPGFLSTSLWHPYIFTKDWNNFLRCRGVGVSHATPLFYYNRMITHCLEASGRYIIDDPTIRLRLCRVKKIRFREGRRENGNEKRLHVVLDTSLSWFHVSTDRYSQSKAYTFIIYVNEMRSVEGLVTHD